MDTGGGIRASEQASLTALNNQIYDNQTFKYEGGGILVDAKSKATISKNAIFDNVAGSNGGGVGVDDHTSLLKITDNDIYNNESEAGGGIAVANGDGEVLISGNNIHGNEVLWFGGGLTVLDNDLAVTVTGNTVYDNVAENGGGIDVRGDGSGNVLIERNNVRDNKITSDWGSGGINIEDMVRQAIVSNNIIAGNDNDGVQGANFKTIMVINNSIVNNKMHGVDMYAWPIEPPDPFTTTLTYNIIAGQGACAVSGGNGVAFSADFNDFWNNGDPDYCWGFNGSNISADPQFVNPAAGDYRLRQDSPAIDAGTSKDAPGYDFDGNGRPFGKGFDMGAYEWPPYRWNLPLIMGAK